MSELYSNRKNLKKAISYILIFTIIFSTVGIQDDKTAYAVNDVYDIENNEGYTLSDNNDIYIHNSTAKLKGDLQHRAHLENGPSAMDWATNVIIDGNYAYVTWYGSHAVTSIDISDPTNMSHAWYIWANGTRRLYGAYDLKKVGNYIYVASYISDSLEVIDATDPTNLKHHGRQTNTTATKLNGARGIDVVWNYAYITSYIDDALQIIDISNPAVPVARWYIQDVWWRLNGAITVSIEGNYAYVASYIDDSLQVIDISDPDTPFFVSEITDTAITELDGAYRVKTQGNYAYVAAYIDDGLEIIDISDPTNPAHVGALDNSTPWVRLNGARGLEVVWNYAYVANYADDNVEIIDISDPTNPNRIGNLDTDSFGRLDAITWIAVDGTNVYTTSYTNSTLQSIDASTITAPVFQWEAESGPVRLWNPVWVLVEWDYAYVASYGSSALEIINISDSANPTHVWSLGDHSTNNELWWAWDLVKKWNYLYISGYGDRWLEVVDVSDPVNPIWVTRFLDNSTTVELQNPRGSDISWDYLYVVSYYGDSLQIFDITNPALPVPTWNIVDNTLLNGANDVQVSWNYAYISSYTRDNISVVDVSNPANPVFITEVQDATWRELNGSWDIDIDGNYVYVSGYVDDSLVILDISDPLNPVYLGDIDDDASMRFNSPRGLVYDEWYTYLSTYSDDSVVNFDVSDPSDILYVDEIRNTDLYDTSTKIDKKDNDIFITQYLWSSLSVLREIYPSNSPYIIPDRHIDSTYFNSMSITLWEHNEWNVSFQLSKDNGATWYYFDGTSWIVTTAGASESNTVSTINTNITGFNALSGTDEIKWKAFFNSNGSQKVELDQVVIDYYDISPPVIKSSNLINNSLMPRNDFEIEYDYYDIDGGTGSGITENYGGIGIDINSIALKIYKWDWVSSWGSDLSASYISSSTTGTGSSVFQTDNIPFGKYKVDFTVSDLNGNTSSESQTLYIDEPEFTVSHPEIDMGTLNDTTNTFSHIVTVTVKTVGAWFDVTMNTTSLPSYSWEFIQNWDWTSWYGYDQNPYSGSLSPMWVNQSVASEGASLNTNGVKNTYSYDIKLWAVIENLQAWWDYIWNIDFWIELKYDH